MIKLIIELLQTLEALRDTESDALIDRLEELEDRIAKYPRKIVITMEGGIIQDIEYIPDGMEIDVIDFDIEGVSDDKLTEIQPGQFAVVSTWKKEGK